MFYPFSQLFKLDYVDFPSEPVAQNKNSPQSISGWVRTWQGASPVPLLLLVSVLLLLLQHVSIVIALL